MVGTRCNLTLGIHCFCLAGWTYTIWAGLMLLSGVLIILDAWKGEAWRKKAEAREALALQGN